MTKGGIFAVIGANPLLPLDTSKAETSQGWNISTTQSYKDFAKAQAEFTKVLQCDMRLMRLVLNPA